MTTLTRSVLLSFSCSNFTYKFNYMQSRCLSTTGVVASSCGPTVNPWIWMSLGTRGCEDQGHIVVLDVKPLYRQGIYV
jgi:hypothetical protein